MSASTSIEMNVDPQIVAAIILVALLAIITIVAIRARWHSLRSAAESRRFKSTPKVGDRAGYRLYGHVWRIGEAIQVDRRTGSAGSDDLYVTLRYPVTTANGVQFMNSSWPVRELRYFAPDEPLGNTIVIDDDRNDRKEG